MSAVYILLLVAVSAAILAVVIDAVLTVSRAPKWSEQAARFEMLDRRKQAVPFVGKDRRAATPAPLDAEPVEHRKAA